MDNKKEETETITIISSDKEDPESEHLERKKAKAMADKSPRKTPAKLATKSPKKRKASKFIKDHQRALNHQKSSMI